MGPYNPQKIEPKWQKVWEKSDLYKAVDGEKNRPKEYILAEFPYPSGDGLHVGHVRRYTVSDVVARHKRMLGQNVLHPIGWDAFGLPTENYAIKNKIPPQKATDDNVRNFKAQLKALGLGFDWKREINTTDPNYYKWTQWIFLKLYEHGLAYQADAPVNWCPFCKVGLADEEVVNGKHERCGTPVEKRMVKQWMLRITKYAKRLIDDLELVDFPDKVATQQINWIGRSEGARMKFSLPGGKKFIEVFTTRPDTIFGATYLVLAPEHPLVKSITSSEQKTEIEKYVHKVANETEIDRLEAAKDKTGVFTGAYAINPATKDKIPIWIADYVLMSYGTGAIMAVPSHDDRDNEFAQKFKLPLKIVIEPLTGEPQQNPEFRQSIVAIVKDPKTGKLLSINWGKELGGNLFVGGGLEKGEDPVKTAIREIQEETGYQNLKLIETSEKIHHHYFAVSKNKARQIEATGLLFELVDDKQSRPQLEADEKGKFKVEWLTVDQADKQVADPLHHYLFAKFIRGQVFTGEGILINSGKYSGMDSALARERIVKDFVKQKLAKEATNYKLRDWVFSRQRYWGEPIPIIHCPKCGIVPVPERDLPVVLPEVKEYEPTGTGESPLAKVTEWVNVKCPQCSGAAKRETDTMPNWAGSSWYYLRYVDPQNDKKFADFDKLKNWLMVDIYVGGMEHTTLHLLYSRFWHKFLYDLKLVPTKEPYNKRRPQGMVLAADGKKMSKSLGNVVNPEVVTRTYGADSLRLLEVFMGPNDHDVQWSEQGVAGMRRFLDRVWELTREYLREAKRSGTKPDNQGGLESKLRTVTHKTIKKVTTDLEEFSFNTAISALMEFVNAIYKIKADLPLASNPKLWQGQIETLLKLLAPFAPHITEELWAALGNKDSIHTQAWPEWYAKLIKDDQVTVVVQINGKVRANLSLPSNGDEKTLIAQAKAEPKIKEYLKDKKVLKTVTVRNKLVNFVVR